MFSTNTATLNALDICPGDSEKVVIAGREVLKILDLRDSVKQMLNLRSGKLNIMWNHVKWSSSYSKQVLVTGATNGSIVVWNLAMASAQKIERIITEHSRSVNKISLHPQESYILLSASQDGTMKLWDLRTKSTARHTFDGKSEAVRDVSFSPMNSYEFAAAFENGNIQKWDLRNPAFYERKWSAHNGLALAVDWHPYGRVLASGGRDRILKVHNVTYTKVLGYKI
jgi:WD40 repeat protein